MLFNSYIFIFLFLPAALLGYFGLNHFGWYRAAKLFLTGNIGLLFYFKYFTFAIGALSRVTHTFFTLPEIVMPLGISFFTFQQIGFLVDTYRGEAGRQNIVDYALFVTFFPQLIAGPIVNQSEMLPQFQDSERKKPRGDDFYEGLRLFILGLGKKVLLADVIGRAAAGRAGGELI